MCQRNNRVEAEHRLEPESQRATDRSGRRSTRAYPFGPLYPIAILLAGFTACSAEPTDQGRPPTLITDTTHRSVPIENELPGDSNWHVNNPPWPSTISVWAAPYSVEPGDSVSVYINADHDSTVTLDVIRVGWYGGLGGRTILEQTVHGINMQPACTPAFPGPVQCPWHISAGFRVGPSWVTGIYLVRVMVPNHAAATYPIVVRAIDRHQFVLVVPQFTWQAYNTSGGSSLYTRDPSTAHSVPMVSFERPFSVDFASDPTTGVDQLAAARWLERSGYDVSYVSDLDLADPDRAGPLPTRGMIFLGHDEYWTWSEFTLVLAMRDAGTHLAFFGANNAYWNIRLAAGATSGEVAGIITCYKRSDDPSATSTTSITDRFRSDELQRPENQLYGVMYTSVTPADMSLDYTVASLERHLYAANAFLVAAGLHPGDQMGVHLSPEGDGIVNNGHTPANLQVLLESIATIPGSSPLHENDAVFFRTAAGAGVFASGDNAWPNFLDGPQANLRIQDLTRAILDWMSGQSAQVQ